MSDNKKMFSIGEIAKSINITRKIILNYESKGLITPDAKDGAAGNRYFTIDTFTKIRTIRIFQKLGLSLDEIRDYFEDKTDLMPLIARLEILRDELNLNIERLYERTSRTQNIVSKISVESQKAFCHTYKVSSLDEKSRLLRETALEAMRSYGTDTTKNMYFTEFSLDTPEEVSFCVAVPPESSGDNIINYPAFEALSMCHHGAYEELADVREMLIAYAGENNSRIASKCRHVYLEGPPQHKDAHRFITRVIIPTEQ